MTKISTQYTSTSYEYDKLDRIVFVVNRSGNATVYEYDANGNRSAVRYANGIFATYSYDSLNRLIKEKIVDKNGKNIAVYEYTLDKMVIIGIMVYYGMIVHMKQLYSI